MLFIKLLKYFYILLEKKYSIFVELSFISFDFFDFSFIFFKVFIVLKIFFLFYLIGVIFVCMYVFVIFMCFNLKFVGDNYEKYIKVI